MKRILLVAAILVAASSLAFGQTSPSNTNRTGNDEQAIRQFINDLNAAVGRNDDAALDRMYADDYTLVDSSGRVTNRAQRLADIRSGASRFESYTREIDSVRQYGNTAVVIAHTTESGQFRGQAMNGQFRNTLTLVRTGGRWRLAAAQATRIAEQ